MKGKLTLQRYYYATVFTDQYSRFYYFIYLQKRNTRDGTVEAKYAFEQFAELNKVTIVHYHADNGHFANNGCIQACKLQNQRLMTRFTSKPRISGY